MLLCSQGVPQPHHANNDSAASSQSTLETQTQGWVSAGISVTGRVNTACKRQKLASENRHVVEDRSDVAVGGCISPVTDPGSGNLVCGILPVPQLPPAVVPGLNSVPTIDPDLAEMLSVLCDIEAELQPGSTYLEDRHGPRALPDHYLDASMRRTAASWLVEVATEFGLNQETLFLGNALLDRFLNAAKGVPRTQLQLAGVACLLIAAKHEEELHPSVLDFTNIADNSFLPADLLRMEAIVLDSLSFRVNTPTAHTFLSMYKSALGLQPRTCALASYLAELGMLEYELLQYRPSRVAASAMLLAQLYTSEIETIRHVASVTSYLADDLQPCMRRLLALQHAAHAAVDYTSPYLAVRDKYSGPQWFSVAKTMPYNRIPACAGLAGAHVEMKRKTC